ncbi:hypothetical protein GRF29_1536g1288076, partial [Pseudopithomyces chartarum]
MIALLLFAVLPLNALAAVLTTDRLPLADISQAQLSSFIRFSEASASFNTNQRPLASSNSFAGNQNDIIDATCKPVTLLFAKGTTEDGSMGALVGPPLAQALGLAIGADNLAVQGVDYDASVEGFLTGGDPRGIAGYDQGAQLLRNAVTLLDDDEKAFVKAAVLLGDPMNGESFAGLTNVKSICHKRDSICAGGKIVDESHLTYH